MKVSHHFYLNTSLHVFCWCLPTLNRSLLLTLNVGLSQAWFRELPTGVLDSLSTDHVMQAVSEDEYTQLVRQLPPIEAALLDWSINLMADVATMEHLNKMNARNIAMVFAPNMTQVSRDYRFCIKC